MLLLFRVNTSPDRDLQPQSTLLEKVAIIHLHFYCHGYLELAYNVPYQITEISPRTMTIPSRKESRNLQSHKRILELLLSAPDGTVKSFVEEFSIRKVALKSAVARAHQSDMRS